MNTNKSEAVGFSHDKENVHASASLKLMNDKAQLACPNVLYCQEVKKKKNIYAYKLYPGVWSIQKFP